MIAKNDTYCLISIIMLPMEMTPYLGYCWSINVIFMMNNNIANPSIPYPVFFLIRLRIRINNAVANDPIERNSPIGSTASNLLSWLSK